MEQIRIAIAEDFTLVRKGFLAILNAEEGFKVVADASNGEELLSLLEHTKVEVDVCLLDVNMPRMNGYETLIALRKRYPSMRFLILTQLEHEFIIVRMLKAGASGYLLKTVEPMDLKNAIRAIMNQPFYNNEQVNGHLIRLVQKGENYKKIMLTPPEEVFLKWCCSELAYKEIANKMSIPERTVIYYRQQLFQKLDVQSRTGLALFALKLGLVLMDGVI